MKILVIGGTGTVGTHLVAELLHRKASVRILNRNPKVHQSRFSNVEWIQGDLEVPDSLGTAFDQLDAVFPDSLGTAFDQLDAVFLLTSIAKTETSQGITAVEAARKAGVPKIVYLSTPMHEHMLHIPHINSKLGIEEAIKQSGMNYTILRPNNFYQNDDWYRDAIFQYGVYPQPLGSVGLNRIDVRDIAYAAANALLLPGFEGKEYPLNGPDALTGEAIADIFAHATGTAVRYAGDDLDDWYQQTITMLPEWIAQDFRVMYEAFQRSGCLATEEDFKLQRQLLQREPRSFKAYVAEIVARWKEIVR